MDCESLPWEPPTGYPNRYRSNDSINRIACAITIVGYSSYCLDTGLGNLWEIPMEGSHRIIGSTHVQFCVASS
jgi:hypothetical protein